MIKNANVKEMEAIQFLAALDGQLIVSEPNIKERLKSIPDAWRQYRIAKKFASNVVTKLYETLPNKTLEYLIKLHHRGEVIVRMKPFNKGGNDKLVPESSLDTLINIAIGAECPICLKSTANVKKCQLRKALLLIAPPDVIPTGSVCPYSGIQQIGMEDI